MILIALGANIPSQAGSPDRTLRASLAALSEKGARPFSVSRAYKTPAWPDPSDPPFVNAVAALAWDRTPAQLMTLLNVVEESFGRTRAARNAPRSLDLDLIDFHGKVEAGPPVLPHPRAAARAFVLVPLMDVAPEWRHPVSRQRVRDLIAALPQSDRASVEPLGPLWP